MVQVIAIIGKNNSGKTLLLTSMGWDGHNKGYFTTTNIKSLTYKDYLISKYEDVEADPFRPFFKNLLLDEFQTLGSSHRSRSKINERNGQFIAQVRKERDNVFYTIPYWTLADAQMRIQTDYLYFPKININKDFIKNPNTFNNNDIIMKITLNAYYPDSEPLFINKVIYIKKWILSLYNTYEKIENQYSYLDNKFDGKKKEIKPEKEGNNSSEIEFKQNSN